MSGHWSLSSDTPSPSVSGSLLVSHTSPTPSLSKSDWSELGVNGQLSSVSITPSPSVSGIGHVLATSIKFSNLYVLVP